MSEETKTRAETVEDNIEDYISQYGAENYNKLFLAIMSDISISLGMIADNTTPSGS